MASTTDTQELINPFEKPSITDLLALCRDNDLNPQVGEFIEQMEKENQGFAINGNIIINPRSEFNENIISVYNHREFLQLCSNLADAIDSIWSSEATITPYIKPTLISLWSFAASEDFADANEFIKKIISLYSNAAVVDAIRYCMANNISNTVVQFFSQLFVYPYGIRINSQLIDLNQNSDKTIHEVIEVENLYLFLEKLNTVAILIKNSANKKWADRFKLSMLWGNATALDFTNPLVFLDRIINILKDRTFELNVNWTPVGHLNSINRDILFRITPSAAEFESPMDMEFIIGPDSTEDYTYQIHSVRAGVASPDTAIIYAVQEPRFNDLTPNFIKRRLYVAEQYKNELLKIFRFHKALKDQLLGNTPIEDLEALSVEEFSLQIIQILLNSSEGFSTIVDLIKYLRSNNLVHVAEIVSEIYNFQISLPKITEAKKIINKRRRNFYKYDSFYKQEQQEESESKNTVMITSLLIALKLFERKGIKRILIPSYLPYRKHTYDPITRQEDEEFASSLDTSIQADKHFIAEKAEEYTKWEITDYGDEGGYITLEINDSKTTPNVPEIVRDIDTIQI